MNKRSPTDLAVVTVAALSREQAVEQYRAFHRFASNARRFLEMYDKKSSWSNDMFVKYLSHESHLSESAVSESMIFDMEDCMSRCAESYKEFNDAKNDQSKFNRIRLSLLNDVDFTDGKYWESFIDTCQDIAEKSKPRKR